MSDRDDLIKDEAAIARLTSDLLKEPFERIYDESLDNDAEDLDIALPSSSLDAPAVPLAAGRSQPAVDLKRLDAALVPHASPVEAKVALEVLARIGTPEGLLGRAVWWLENGDDPLRGAAVRAIGSASGAAVPAAQALAGALSAMPAAHLATTETRKGLLEALTALMADPGARPLLLYMACCLLADEDVQRRKFALEVLGRVPRSAALPAAQTLAAALSAMPAAHLATTETSEGLLEALAALMADPDARPLLLDAACILLADEDAHRRQFGLEVMGRVPSSSVGEMAGRLRAMRDGARAGRRTLGDALERLVRKEAPGLFR